jgi:Helix-turn-helix domain
MSVRQMLAVFELRVPASWKLVLLAMADHAHEDGTGCYPSIDTLARKTSQSRRGVQKIMRKLEEAGLIYSSNESRGGPRCSTEYTLTHANSEPRSLLSQTQPRIRVPATPNADTPNSEPRSLLAQTQPRTRVPATANAGTPNSEPQCSKQRTGFARTIKNLQELSLNLGRLSPPSSPSPVEKGVEEKLSQLARAKSVTPVGKTQKEIDARRRLLLDQAAEIQKKFQSDGLGSAKAPIVTNPRVRYAQIGQLSDRAAELLRAEPQISLGDLAEELKQWAANNGFTYFDASADAATPIQQAITIAIERRKTA